MRFLKICILSLFLLVLSLNDLSAKPSVGKSLRRIRKSLIEAPFGSLFEGNQLDEIHEDIKEIKASIDILKSSSLNAALSAFSDAKKIKDETEKLDTIRSAKRFLLDAIHLESDVERKALAQYMLGHYYILVKEFESAEDHFKEVLFSKNKKSNSWWSTNTTYNDAISTLKREASSILCAIYANKNKGSETNPDKDLPYNWCAVSLAYSNISALNDFNQLEDCVLKKDKTMCELVGQNLLMVYGKTKELSSVVVNDKTSAVLNVTSLFSPEDVEEVKISSTLLDSKCGSQNNSLVALKTHEDFLSCYLYSNALLSVGEHQSALDLNYKLCDMGVKNPNLEMGIVDLFKTIIKSNGICDNLSKEPYWSITSQEMRLGLIKERCIMDDLNACARLLTDKDFYDPLIKEVASHLLSRCFERNNQVACALIRNSNTNPDKSYTIKINKLKVGLNPDGSTWDIRGDRNPDVNLTIAVKAFLGGGLSHVYNIYKKNLSIKEVRADASGNPLTYVMDVNGEESFFVDERYITDFVIEYRIVDVDPISDDLIGEQATLKKAPIKKFGSVIDFETEIVEYSIKEDRKNAQPENSKKNLFEQFVNMQKDIEVKATSEDVIKLNPESHE